MHYTILPNATDSYKVGHRAMYPKGMTGLLSNWTARGSRVAGLNHVVFFGLQAALTKISLLAETTFFSGHHDVIDRHKKRVEKLLGCKFDASHWHDLKDLGYLPLSVRALPEGTRVPIRVPCFVVENTEDDFAWLVNYFESLLSAEIWQPMTSATIADHFRQLLNRAALQSGGDLGFVDFQGHDFSFRGMAGMDAAAASAAGHLLSFAGTDCLVGMDWLDEYYPSKPGLAPTASGFSVPASEHSVMCAGGKMGELETFQWILDRFPTGIVSVVSDTWDLWKVITEILPQLKDRILARGPGMNGAPGKLVIRPDSGDPVLIVCGDDSKPEGHPARKGVVELLWDLFGGTTNPDGFRSLDSHIGVIYGDAITLARANEICERLRRKKFSSTNVVLGIGSFTYQYVTRDTFSMAMKATWAKVDGEDRDLFKDPVTDDGVKRSAVGRIAVLRRSGATLADDSGELYLVSPATPEQERDSLLRTVFFDGVGEVSESFRTIAKRLGNRLLLPE